MHKVKLLLIMTMIVLATGYVSSAPRAGVVGLSANLPGGNFAAGVASYYSYECAKLPMANGKPFDPEKRTCASWFYDFGTVLLVKSLDTGRTTRVVVTDRGPNKRLVKRGRVIDLSKRAFEDICELKKGLTRVIVTVKSRQ